MKRKHTAVAGRQPGLNLEHRAQPASLFMVLWGVAVLCLAVVTYFFGLDSLQIPKNGDEFPYAHIARLTAESGHWLPLQSTLDHMRNTKPPLLFWQGILQGGL